MLIRLSPFYVLITLLLIFALSQCVDLKAAKHVTGETEEQNRREVGKALPGQESVSLATQLSGTPKESVAKTRLKTKIPNIKAPGKAGKVATNSTKKAKKLIGSHLCGTRCCSGWSLAPKTKKCTKPQCAPRCLNGGLCERPHTCVCKPGFEGPRCETTSTSQGLSTPIPTSPPTSPSSTTSSLGAVRAGRAHKEPERGPRTPSQTPKKHSTVRWHPLTLKEAQSVLQKKSSGSGGLPEKMTALLSKHVEAQRGKLLSAGLLVVKESSVKIVRTSQGEYTVYRTPAPARNQNTAGERIKVLFTPTICKVRCAGGRCTNHCERGNVTTVYSSERGYSPHGAGFRVFLCPLLCQNGGICMQKDHCLCPPNFTGKFCHVPVSSSTNEIEGAVQNRAASSNQQGLTQSVYTLPLHNHQSQQSGGSEMVKVHVQHPLEASVNIHQVQRVREGPAQGQRQGQGDVIADRRAPVPRIQAQTIRGDSSYSESSGFGYCFQEVRNGQCSSPLPGLRTQEICCRGQGKAWGISECALCPSNQGSGASVDGGCPKGFERINGTQCVDVNECSLPRFCQNGECINTRGSYSCVCKTGYILDASQGRCISQLVISESKGQCYRILKTGFCSLPILRNITKQICCCSRVGKAWGRACERCPPFGSEQFKEICPAGPGYHYSASSVKINQERQIAVVPPRDQTPPLTANVGHEREERPVQPLQPEHPVQPVRPVQTFTVSTTTRAATRAPEVRVCDLNPQICGAGRCLKQRGGAYTCLCNQGYHISPQQTRCVDVDECSLSPRPCMNSQCENTAGSYRCLCPSGFRLGLQGASCTDIDECQQSPGPCTNARCENTPGSYRCVCAAGYQLDPQGAECTDINECENAVTCPGQECVNSAGSFQCVPCQPGYQLKNGRCIDVDECSLSPRPCMNGQCENTAGSYRCLCPSGFRLGPQGASCTDIDECRLMPRPCSIGHCENTAGSYRCVCPTGYRLNPQGSQCIDIDECRQSPGPCTNARCENTPGSYRCVCAAGYQLDPQGAECTDINECENAVTCPGQECVNSAGSFQCVPCQPGYQLKNGRCIDVDECLGSLVCGTNGQCVNTDGSFSCDCKIGFRSDSSRRQCSDINECLEGDFCFPHGECLNTEGSYSCLCSEGYKATPDGGSCIDVDECARPELCQDGSCTNTQGSFECVCQPGFATNPEKTACLDVEECAESRGAVCGPRRCENTIGSFHCITSCEPGHRATASGDCVDINECVNDTVCGDHAFCQNLIGSYQCLCDQGYKAGRNGRSCVDVNECDSMQGACGAARCENVEGSFLCICGQDSEEFDPRTGQCLSRDGEAQRFPSSSGGVYRPDPSPPRSDVRECYYNIHDANVCQNILTRNATLQECCCTVGEGWGENCQLTACPAPGTAEYQSVCPSGKGYLTSAPGSFSYKDVDECTLFSSEVCKNGVCVNTIPGYSCYCPNGYYYDQTQLECVDNDECLEEESCLGGSCVNTMGSYYCSCNPPLILDAAQRECVANISQSADENLAYCWQELGDGYICNRPLLDRQITYTECCCLYGLAWGIECALCPTRDSDDYEALCNVLRPPAYGPPVGPYAGEYGPDFGGDYEPPYGPDTFAEPPPRGRTPDYLRPGGFEDYPPRGGQVPSYGSRSRSPASYRPQEGPYGRRGPGQSYDLGDFESDLPYVPPESEPRPPFGRADSLIEPSYESRQGRYRSLSPQPVGPPFEPDEPSAPWLQYRPREAAPYPEYPDRPLGGIRRETYESRYESYEGLSAEECGILRGCQNGRCIRVPEGYTCDCYDGYHLDMTTMTCIDINECDEADDPSTLCVNGQCLNTDGSYQCVCLRGFVMSRQRNYCIPARPRQ
ncbi:latent-transforming growth factor beta-binding protein 4 isoform X1 [Huso huso]|uniref:Latent-transforming growth factor beta-binding protein 4 isoform X1 n=1 Tax=Huso huso TaxID=61971 RepID=A0ABR0YDW7_HUSHU